MDSPSHGDVPAAIDLHSTITCKSASLVLIALLDSYESWSTQVPLSVNDYFL